VKSGIVSTCQFSFSRPRKTGVGGAARRHALASGGVGFVVWSFWRQSASACTAAEPQESVAGRHGSHEPFRKPLGAALLGYSISANRLIALRLAMPRTATSAIN
jgi:hypothetical protein